MSVEHNPTTGITVDLLGPSVELLTPPDGENDFCVLRGTVPARGFVPMHSHPDTEGFVVLSGEVQALRTTAGGHEWLPAAVGDYVHMGGDAPHAWRNVGDGPAEVVIVAANRLARFLREMGRPAAEAGTPPTPAYLAHVEEVAGRYGYWLASPEENAAVGIDLRPPAG